MKNRKYLDWVKTLDCCMCGAPADDPHHLIGVGGGIGGTATKAADYLAMPMCRGDHNAMHANHELWPDQWIYLARTLRRAFDEDKIKFT